MGLIKIVGYNGYKQGRPMKHRLQIYAPLFRTAGIVCWTLSYQSCVDISFCVPTLYPHGSCASQPTQELCKYTMCILIE